MQTLGDTPSPFLVASSPFPVYSPDMATSSKPRRGAGSRVHGVATECGHTIASLSRETGIPYTTLRRKLTGVTEISVPDLLRIAVILGVPPTRLLPDEFKAAS